MPLHSRIRSAMVAIGEFLGGDDQIGFVLAVVDRPAGRRRGLRAWRASAAAMRGGTSTEASWGRSAKASSAMTDGAAKDRF